MSEEDDVDATREVQVGAPPRGGARPLLRAWTSIVRAMGGFGGRLGLLIVAAGLVIIGVGWNGAAGAGGEVNHVPTVQAQLPWLLSGGFLGLGVVVLGAALIIANAHREGEARLAARLDALLEAANRGVGAAVASNGHQAAPGTDEEVIAGTASYHRPTCRLVRGRADARRLSVGTAVAEGLAPCRVCRPPSCPPLKV